MGLGCLLKGGRGENGRNVVVVTNRPLFNGSCCKIFYEK